MRLGLSEDWRKVEERLAPADNVGLKYKPTELISTTSPPALAPQGGEEWGRGIRRSAQGI